MFIFGHIGITLGIFYLLSRLSSKNNFWINVPWIVIGALLPDIIDKPLGRIILAETIGSGRIFAHTLLFGFLLGLAGYYLYSQQKPELLVIAGASFCHILEDQIWNTPEVFFWPLFGWGFPEDTISGSFIEYLMIIFSRSYDPEFTEVFISEIIGLIIIVLLTGKYIQKKMKEKSIV
ncbi:metal-dependent hydrolase [Methanosarcina sp.]|uniref:metal-dependent hydrolase n=1 Tax=Methanosarcina sp. TaxID=2213 RepID=UPI003C76CDF9